MDRKFFIRTFGCQMNEHDSERLATDLSASGLVRTDQVEEADVVLLNTCCIRENADNKLYGHLGHLKSLRDRRPGMQIAVAGCLAQKERGALLERAPFLDVVVGTHNLNQTAQLLEAARATGHAQVEVLDVAGADPDALPSAARVRPELAYTAWVTIQAGCDNACAFCIVPAVRGPEQSRPFGALIEEIGQLAQSGTVEVTLLGQNVNSYGRDLTVGLRRAGELAKGAQGRDEMARAARLVGSAWLEEGQGRARPLFGDLLRAVGAVPGIRRVRFTSPHPKDLREDTIAAMAETEAVCEQLHLPLQSGSDAVLSAMRRGYTAQRYLDRLAAARAAIADLAVTTDLIVGFPGETDEDFEATLEVVAEARYDSAFTFVFSPRPGTRAAEMVDRFVDPAVVADRFERLRVVVERSALRANEARVGRVEEVVVEGVSRKDPSVLAARTRQGKLVHFPRADVERLTAEPFGPGGFGSVEITSAAPHHLAGRLVEVESTPRLASTRRGSIPLRVS